MTAQRAGRRLLGTRAARKGRSASNRGELAVILEGYMTRDGRSLNRIAQSALVDVAYLWRLREGDRRNPSRDLLIRLGLALRLEPEEVDELLVAANHAPLTLRAL